MTADSIDVRLSCGITVPAAPPGDGSERRVGEAVSIGVRPEQMILVRDRSRLPDDSAITTQARIMNRIFLGEHTEYLLRDERLGEFLALAPRQNEISERPFETTEVVHVAWSREAALVLGGE